MHQMTQMLENNDCNKQNFMDILHLTFMLYILEQICSNMKQNPVKRLEILRIYRSSPDNIITAQKIASLYCGVRLSHEEAVWLDRCLHAFFQKKSHRKRISTDLKLDLLKRQNHLCACCSTPISIHDHCDHIIPWDFVGDELNDNYQMLCEHCNECKSLRPDFLLKKSLIKVS